MVQRIEVELAAAEFVVPSEGSSSSPSSSGSSMRITTSMSCAAMSEQILMFAVGSAGRLQLAESALFPAVYLSRVFRPPRV